MPKIKLNHTEWTFSQQATIDTIKLILKKMKSRGILEAEDLIAILIGTIYDDNDN